MAAIAHPSWCEHCVVMSWKSKERQLETPSMLAIYGLFALHCLLISRLTSLHYLFFLYHFFSTMLMFPRWPEHHHSAGVAAWMCIRTWRITCVNRTFVLSGNFFIKGLKTLYIQSTVELPLLVDNQYTVFFLLFFWTLWRSSMLCPSIYFFLYTLPSRG